jgi:integrase
MTAKPRGRPKKYAEYEALLANLPKQMAKRPKYLNGIGVFRGARSVTAWVKIRLTHGGIFNGRSNPKGAAVEIKVGQLSSWPWKELEAKRDELQGKADRGEPLEEEAPQLFSEFAADWLERLKKRTRGYHTTADNLNAHLLPFFGMKTIDSIRVGDFNRYISNRLTEAKPATVKREVGTLNAILNDAVRSGYLETNPGRYADKIKGIAPRQRFLDSEETIRLLTKAEETAEWLPDFILWCLHSGMRKGEVLQLTWSDVQIPANGRHIIQIHKSKTDQPRVVVCTKTMIEILARQREREKDDNERVFPIAKMTLRRKWEAARKEAGLEDVTIHDLRRTHSTQAAVAGVDLRTLAGRLGHANLAMLEKHYAALVGSASEEAADKIEKALSATVDD